MPLNLIISKMSIAIVNIVKRVLVSRETKITLLVEPDRRRREILNSHPLSYVKFSAFNQQWILNIFLNHELSGETQRIVSNVVDIIEATDAPSS